MQDNHSRSAGNILRGLHFQTDPGQAKLVRCLRGRIWDVAVDLRRDSPTYRQWEGHELDDERHHQLFVPVGFAHGFCVLSDVADVAYKLSSHYDPATEAGIAWDDPRSAWSGRSTIPFSPSAIAARPGLLRSLPAALVEPPAGSTSARLTCGRASSLPAR